MRFILGMIIANWKLFPIPRRDDLKYSRHWQFLTVSAETESCKLKRKLRRSGCFRVYLRFGVHRCFIIQVARKCFALPVFSLMGCFVFYSFILLVCLLSNFSHSCVFFVLVTFAFEIFFTEDDPLPTPDTASPPPYSVYSFSLSSSRCFLGVQVVSRSALWRHANLHEIPQHSPQMSSRF